MEKMNYELAIKELKAIVEDLQEGKIKIDDLAEKADRAKELIHFCKDKLRTTEESLAN